MEEYSRYILSRLLKKSKITSIIKAESYLFSKSIKNIHLLMDQSHHFNEAEADVFQPKTIKITYHTLERWNQRVGPVVNLETLQKTIDILFKNFAYRVMKLDQGIGSIDNEIIFTYETTDHEFVITTFYGRKSLMPALNQMKTLRNYNLYSHDQVNLALTEEELLKQELPLIPKEVVYFNGKKTSYILEKYMLTDRQQPCFLCYKKEFLKKSFTAFVIDLEKPELISIPRNVLSMLNWLGFGRFVLDYFNYHHQDKVIKAGEKAHYYLKNDSITF